MPNFQTTKTIAGHEVVPGLRLPHPSGRDRLQFNIQVVCDSAEPERWHGEVNFSGSLVLATPPVGSHTQAGREAEQALARKVVEIFSD
jgi:hypothetical protein